MTNEPDSNGEIEEEPTDPDLPSVGGESEDPSGGSRNPAHAEQQERLRKMFESPGMSAFIEQTAGQQERLRKMFESPGMSAFIKQTAEQQERLRKMFASPAWLESIARVAEAYRRWDEGERRLLDLLAPRGWVISPSSTIADLSALVATADAHGIEAAENAFLAELTPQRTREIIEGLYGRPSFAQWREPLDQALRAHEEGLFALAVPVWLIALDGIFFSELGIEGVFGRVHRKNGRAVKRLLGSARGERLLDALVDAIRAVAQHFPHGATPSPGELRRNVIMHGLDPAYGTEKASVQGVLLLEVLHFQLEQLDSAKALPESQPRNP